MIATTILSQLRTKQSTIVEGTEYPSLQDLAKKHNIDPKLSKADIVAALTETFAKFDGINVTIARKLRLKENTTIEGRTYPSLIEVAQANNVTYTDQKKWDLLDQIIEILAAKRSSAKVSLKLTIEQQAVIDSTDLSKSDKMRELYRLGVSVANIARVLGAHYSFVHGVVQRYNQSAKSGEAPTATESTLESPIESIMDNEPVTATMVEVNVPEEIQVEA